jgi:hypothetical protein
MSGYTLSALGSSSASAKAFVTEELSPIQSPSAATKFENSGLAPSPNPIPGAPGCPNTNWTEQIVDLAFTQATLTVIQPATSTTVVFTAACIFTPATKNGVVPDNEVSCTIE